MQSTFRRLIGLALLVFTGLAQAQSGQCSFIQDPSLQAQCRAASGGGSGQCSFIRDNDMQAACRARFG